MNKTEENIKSELRKLKNIFEDKKNYSSDERRKSLNKYYNLVDLLNDKGDEFKEIYVMGPKSSPVGKPGPNRSRQRESLTDGGILGDDRARYGMKEGGKGIEALRKVAPKVVERMGYEHGGPHTDTRTEDERQMDYLESAYERAIETGQKEDAQNVADQIDKLQTKIIEEKAKESDKLRKAEGGDIDGQMTMLMMPSDPEEEMLPDDEMEDEYLDFILDEALDNDEEEYLMSQLQDNDQLSMIFDKVIDVAQEFAGSGPVEGPGSGVSDSIPARLSDGEFVFTAKAVEEIGADNLMAMMKDAEMKADGRQGLANGGEPEEETVVVKGDEPVKQEIRVVKDTVDSTGRMIADEDEISKNIKTNMMLDPNQQHVRS
jgi:hypothetical protein